MKGPCQLPGWDDAANFEANISAYFVESCSETGRKWWKASIAAEAVRCGAPVVDLRSLKAHFSKGPLTPMCLPGVVSEMEKAGALIPVKSLVGPKEPPQSWLSAVGAGVYKGAGLLVSLAIGSEHSEPATRCAYGDDEGFLVVECVKGLGERIRSKAEKGGVVRVNEALEALRAAGEAGLSVSEGDAVMAYLEREGEAARFEAGGEAFLKISARPGEKVKLEADDTVSVTRGMLEKARERLAEGVKREDGRARECVRAKDRPRALAALGRKKEVAERLRQVEVQLANLDAMEEALEAGRNNAAVLDALRTSTEALKEVNKATPIEEVEKVMDAAKDARDEQQKIQEALCGDPESDADMLALERELDELEELGRKEGEGGGMSVASLQEALDAAPPPPSAPPVAAGTTGSEAEVAEQAENPAREAAMA